MFGYVVAFASVILYDTSCNNRTQQDRWNEALIDAKLSENMIYLQLDRQPEIFSFGEKQDSLAKRTSDAAYLKGEKINLADSSSSKYNNCRASLVRDTLLISIGIADGFALVIITGIFTQNPTTGQMQWIPMRLNQSIGSYIKI